MMDHKNRKVSETKQIDNATFEQCGFKGCTVRMTVGKKVVGFATTAYSWSMTDEVRQYAAERIGLLMTISQGFSNEQLSKMQLKQTKGGE